MVCAYGCFLFVCFCFSNYKYLDKDVFLVLMYHLFEEKYIRERFCVPLR